MHIFALLPRLRLLLVLPLAALFSGGTAGAATKFLPLYLFQGGDDGKVPHARLLRDDSGALYGTTSEGGSDFNAGTVFMLTPPATAGGNWTETVLHTFSCISGGGCPDGTDPEAGLIMDGAGNLYGTTAGGGSPGGVVFQLTPNADRTDWTYSVLYRFCKTGGSCPDGLEPRSELIMDAAGNLYGTTVKGGAPDLSGPGRGVAFQLSPNAAGTAWTETAVYQFCSVQPNCADGAAPAGRLIMDAAGNLYGAAGNVVFELTPNDAHTAFTERVLYKFCSQSNCADGATPAPGGLSMDAQGDLYGTTQGGGGSGFGVVFELIPNADGTAWSQTVLYSFCQLSNCSDGSTPNGDLVIDAAGNLLGTTNSNGNLTRPSIVFQLTPDPSGGTGTETVLHQFCQVGGSTCADGVVPEAGVVMDAKGNLYGTTAFGGAGAGIGGSPGNGIVFELARHHHRRH